MHSRAIKRMEINRNLSLIPEDKIDQIANFIEFFLYKSQARKRTPVRLRGIWKNKGFEKIKDMESELKEARASLTKAILKRDV